VGYARGPFDGAGPQVRADALVARSSKPGWSLVVSEEDKRTFAVQIQCSLQRRKQRQKHFSQASDGPALVDDEVSAASEQELQLGELLFTCSKLAELRAYSRLVSDDASITSIGFGLAAVGVAGSVYGEARDEEHPLVSLPQHSASKSAALPPGWSTAQTISSANERELRL
jgi:hypothetical protein